VGLPKEIKVIADITCKDRVNFEAGGNETHFHNLNVNFERDFPTPEFVDIREVKEGDICPKCGKGHLKKETTIELGHVFKLGTVYTESMKAHFTDTDGKAKPMEMGCYGIGISRMVAAIVEVSHDEKGMIWPKSVAPYMVHLISLGSDEKITKEADKIYEELLAAGTEVLYDDRDETAGVKFADADLIGIPIRVLVSGKSVEKGGAEWKLRNEKDSEIVDFKNLKKKIENFIAG
jgi:prolyl-tRNA synthetase